jgi:hypothetical protein
MDRRDTCNMGISATPLPQAPGHTAGEPAGPAPHVRSGVGTFLVFLAGLALGLLVAVAWASELTDALAAKMHEVKQLSQQLDELKKHKGK